ncbi:MAG TPA: metallophosphoesterase [Pyrinomonadaceae bacterium]|nr:metallophosphoesterase [Pyrinomonadaceae bacterium]
MTKLNQPPIKPPEVKPVKRLPMVGWYDPRQLAKTGVEVAVSTIFGRHSDHRLVEAMAADDDTQDFFDYSCYYDDSGHEIILDQNRKRDAIWVDYVGDVGDGWNSTYAIAYNLAKCENTFTYTDSKTKKTLSAQTKRGDVLIFGGDEVYPTASREEYDQRLVAPYETALRYSESPSPHVYAIPGNHDWYDSLVAFTRLFTARPWFAGWRTRQSRSYFALKLPHSWWLLGTDLQLGSDIDKPQMEYFQKLTAHMDDNARIILCHAEPHWIRAAQYGGDDPNYNESNLKLLEKRLGHSVAVFIAGDLHHYRRHESEDQSTQKITAGGGGAFMHPTHYGRGGTKLDVLIEKGLHENEERIFNLKGCFPSTKDSSRVTWRNLLFPFFWLMGNKSWSFGLVIAALYFLLTVPIISTIDDLALKGEHQFAQITYVATESLIHSQLSMFLALATIGGFVFFTESHKKWFRIVMGGAHGIAHVLAAFSVGLLVVYLVAANTTADAWTLKLPWFGVFQFPLDLRLVLAGLAIYLLAFFIGSFIMGLYLALSLNVFGRHGNEAFSSLGVEDWKNFVRLHINEQGDLTIYPVGIRRVPRKWKQRNGNNGPELEPDPQDHRATAAELIEPPIVMKRAATETGVKADPTAKATVSYDNNGQSQKK